MVGSIRSYVVIHVRRRAIAAYPEGRSPNHKGRGFGVVQAFQLGFKAGAARAVTGMEVGLLAQIGNAQEKIGEAGMRGEQTLITVSFKNGFEFRSGKCAFDGRDRAEKRVYRPRQNEFGPALFVRK